MSSSFPGTGNRSAGRSDRRRRSRVPLSVGRAAYEGVALVLGAVPAIVGPWLYGATRPWAYGALAVCAFLAVLLVALRPLLFSGVRELRPPPAWMLLAAWLLYGLVRVPGAAVPHEAAVALVRALGALGAMWVWSELAGPGNRWRWVLVAVLMSAVFMAGYAFVQQAHGSARVLDIARPAQYGLRASGAFLCPNHFAALLNTLAPVALALLVLRGDSLPLRLVGGYALAMFVPALYLTQSRSGWLGLGVGLGVTVLLLALRRGAQRFLAALVVVPAVLAAAGAALWMLSPMVQSRVAAAARGEDLRPDMWRDTAGLIRLAPWFGWGPGSFRWVYPSHQKHVAAYLDPGYAHNEILHHAAESGAVGVALGAAAVGALAVSFLRRLRRVARERDAALSAAAVGALAAALAHGLFDFNLQVYPLVHVLALVLGVAAGVQYEDGARPARPLASTPWPLAGVAMAAAACAAAAFAVGLGYWLTLRGDEAREASRMDQAERLFRRAARVDPWAHLPRLGLADIRRRQAFWSRPPARAELLDEARRHYEGARSLNRWDPHVDHGLALVAELEGDSARALAGLRDLTLRLPRHVFFLTEYGDRLLLADRPAEALAAYEAAYRLEPIGVVSARVAQARERLGPAPAPGGTQ